MPSPRDPDPAPDGGRPSGEAGADGPDERRLVERVRHGDRTAFGRLVEIHGRKAFSVAYRFLENRQDAEDLVQEAFMVALDRIDTFEEGRPFGPWLYRIVVNRSLNARRARERRADARLPASLASSGPRPDEEARRSMMRERVDEALETLTPRQRAVVRLFELEGFTGPEVAEILGISEGTVRWHAHRAREALRKLLADDRRGYPNREDGRDDGS